MCQSPPHHILVVEDEWLIAQTTLDLLSDEGYLPLGPAPSVGQALDLIASEPVCAAVLDVNLGSEKSFPIADDLARRGIPFLFVTGYRERDLPPRFGGARLLAKPIDPAHLRSALGGMLEAA